MMYRAIHDPKFSAKPDQGKAAAWSLCVKIARSCTEDEFVDYVQNGNSPVVKLTPEEMEMLKGGITPVIVAGLVITGAILHYYGK
jgi:hypothetical protein